MLGIEEWISAARQAKIAPQFVDGLGPVAGGDARQSLDHMSHSRHGPVGARQAGIGREHRRIERGEEGERRENVACPGNSGDLGDHRAGVIQFAQQQEIGARRLGGRVQQVFIGLAQRREEKVAQSMLRPMLDVVDHLDK